VRRFLCWVFGCHLWTDWRGGGTARLVVSNLNLDLSYTIERRHCVCCGKSDNRVSEVPETPKFGDSRASNADRVSEVQNEDSIRLRGK